MIDEDVLRGLFAEAAESVPPPGDAPTELLAEIEAQAEGRSIREPGRPSRDHGRRTRRVLEVAALLIVLVGGAAIVLGTASSDRQTVFHATGSAIGGGGGGVASGPQSEATVPAVDSGEGSTGGGSAVTGDSAKVVKTGALDLEVPDGSFQKAVDRITAQVVGLGGYLSDSTTREADDIPSGSLTARVPAKDFEHLVATLGELGEVQSVTTKGTDVSDQLTDLDARLTALRSTRDRLSAVLAQAKSVNEILAVQDRITQVQTQIEQLEGQQRVLEDQTAMATLTITVGEPGAERLEAAGPSDGGLGGAWDDARERFGDGVEAIVEWSGPLLLILLIGLAGLVLGRLGWTLWRRRTV